MRADVSITSLHLIGFEELKKCWGRIVLLGALFVLLGIVALSSAILFTFASVIFFGSLMIAAGILQAANALATNRWGGHVMDLLIGLLSAVVGLLIVLHPGTAAAGLTLLIGAFLIVGGIFRFALAFSFRFHNRFWIALHGVISLILGSLILQQWPLSGLWVIGLFIGIDMMFNGWSLITLGLVAKQIPTETT